MRYPDSHTVRLKPVDRGLETFCLFKYIPKCSNTVATHPDQTGDREWATGQSTAVQIGSFSRRGSRGIEYIGSAHDVELEVLNADWSPGSCSPLESTERAAVTHMPAQRQREPGESRR